jgi:hypothetical protein
LKTASIASCTISSAVWSEQPRRRAVVKISRQYRS